MGSSWVNLMTLALMSLSSVQCNKVCKINDNRCNTMATERRYPSIIFEGNLEPLKGKNFQENIYYLNCNLSNPVLSNLKNCRVEKSAFYPKNSFYRYGMECPHLEFKSKYLVTSKNETGMLKVSADDVFVLIMIHYNETKKDNKTYVNLLLTNDRGQIVADGIVTTKVTPDNGDKDHLSRNAAALSSDNNEVAGKLISGVITKFWEGLRDYYRKYPKEEIFTEE